MQKKLAAEQAEEQIESVRSKLDLKGTNDITGGKKVAMKPEDGKPLSQLQSLLDQVSHNVGGAESDCSGDDDSGDEVIKTKKGKKKSGLYKKASDKNKRPQEWPHLHLRLEFTSKNFGFHDLCLNTLVAGEMDIILKCDNDNEKKCCMEFLQLLMYYAESVAFEQILQWYADWIRGVERGDHVWGDDPFKSGEGILARAKLGKSSGKVCTAASNSQWGDRGLGNKAKNDNVWFCSAYQRNRCSKTSPHTNVIKGINREVSHICATCFQDSRKQLKHPESSSACPLWKGDGA